MTSPSSMSPVGQAELGPGLSLGLNTIVTGLSSRANKDPSDRRGRDSSLLSRNEKVGDIESPPPNDEPVGDSQAGRVDENAGLGARRGAKLAMASIASSAEDRRRGDIGDGNCPLVLTSVKPRGLSTRSTSDEGVRSAGVIANGVEAADVSTLLDFRLGTLTARSGKLR